MWITQICNGLTTASDSCTFELGYTDAANGGGTFYPMTMERHVATGTSPQGRFDFDLTITPPLGPLQYADGVRSITFRVNANDASASINVAWHGFIINHS